MVELFISVYIVLNFLSVQGSAALVIASKFHEGSFLHVVYHHRHHDEHHHFIFAPHLLVPFKRNQESVGFGAGFCSLSVLLFIPEKRETLLEPGQKVCLSKHGYMKLLPLGKSCGFSPKDTATA